MKWCYRLSVVIVFEATFGEGECGERFKETFSWKMVAKKIGMRRK